MSQELVPQEKEVTVIAVLPEIAQIIEKRGLKSKTIGIELSQEFSGLIAQKNEMIESIKELTVTDESDEEGMKKCKEARLSLRKIRTTSDKIRKELKAESNAYNKVVEDCYDLIEHDCEEWEKKMEDGEKFREREMAKRAEQLRQERIAKLGELIQYVSSEIDLAYISEDDFETILLGAEAKAKKASDEAERVRLEEIEKARIREVGDSRRRSYWQYSQFFELTVTSDNAEFFASIEQSEWDNALKVAVAKHQDKQKQDELLRKENERLQKIADEKKAQDDAARKEQQKLKGANDKQKLAHFQSKVEQLKNEVPTCDSENGKMIAQNIETLLQKVVSYIAENSNKAL